MIRRAFRRGLAVGLLGGVIVAAVRTIQNRRDGRLPAPEPVATWPPIPDTTPVVVPEHEPEPPAPVVLEEPPAPAKKVAPKKQAEPRSPWVESVDGECPSTHPVKAKLSSQIFHLPGGFNYPRTRPDRCYLDAAAAEADGLRPAKR